MQITLCNHHILWQRLGIKTPQYDVYADEAYDM